VLNISIYQETDQDTHNTLERCVQTAILSLKVRVLDGPVYQGKLVLGFADLRHPLKKFLKNCLETDI
jgi:hypothetical protein